MVVPLVSADGQRCAKSGRGGEGKAFLSGGALHSPDVQREKKRMAVADADGFDVAHKFVWGQKGRYTFCCVSLYSSAH